MNHVRKDLQVMLDDYFSGFRMRCSTDRLDQLGIGIGTSCTTSQILFVMAMEVILKAAEGTGGPANLGCGCYMTTLKAFMDYTAIICSNEDETRQMLQRLDILTAWGRMKFKPKKSRRLLVRKVKIDATTTFTVANQQISTISQEPVQSLGSGTIHP
ncbi:hypothetical protein RRG08_025132 [Elysia crispata]|uniref:Reverse transcriptase domain-containing protein n=1 Tax=Elysia crispata TaxID=231223 RepID=A0AAE0ZUL3_9GAST|nr:hypothetical protein RRG08_025132 [Elysia crispata]